MNDRLEKRKKELNGDVFKNAGGPLFAYYFGYVRGLENDTTDYSEMLSDEQRVKEYKQGVEDGIGDRELLLNE